MCVDQVCEDGEVRNHLREAQAPILIIEELLLDGGSIESILCAHVVNQCEVVEW